MVSDALISWRTGVDIYGPSLLVVGTVILVVMVLPVHKSPFLLGATLALGYWLVEKTMN